MNIKQILKTILPDDTIVKMKNILNDKNNKNMLEKQKHIKTYEEGRYPKGINLIGDIKAETGLGQSMRIIAHIIKERGIPFTIIQVDSPGSLMHSETEYDDYISEEAKFDCNLIHINPNIWAENYLRFPMELLNYRYNIAYWLWELEEFPEEWCPCIQTVDEIWVPSEFIGNSIRKRTDKLVKTVPYVIRTAPDFKMDRKYFQLPEEKFLFLMMYDFKSISERKNPKGVIEAYKIFYDKYKKKVRQIAVETHFKEPGLVIKVNHIKGGKEFTMLKEELKDIPNVYYLTGNMSRTEVDSLIATADLLVSLHRSEGFGLPLAEAMQMGTPVIATNWSATTEFMDEESACLVDYKLITLEKNIGPYKKGNRWADADLEQAAIWMEKLYWDKDFYLRIKENAEKAIERYLSIAKMKQVWGDKKEK